MKKIEDIECVPEELRTSNYLNHSVSCRLPIYQLIRVMQGESKYNKSGDLRHPENIEIKNKVLRLMELPLDIDMDTFNREYNGMTKRQYVDFLNSVSI